MVSPERAYSGRRPRARAALASALLALIFALPAAVCAGESTLMVVDGNGSGNYAPGTLVHIWANPYDSADPERTVAEPDNVSVPMTVFDRWVGDTGGLADVRSAQTTIVMPSGPVQVTATYKPVERWAPPRLISNFPPNHRGVIFMLHGGGGNCGAACFADLTEVRAFVKNAESRGYAVVLLQSHDYRNNPWGVESQSAADLDVQRIRGARKHLVAQGRMRASDPVYLLGISGGGMFASLLQHDGQGRNSFPVEAMAIYVASGFSSNLSTGTVPTIFCLARNDAVGPNEAALQNFGALLNNGVPTQYHELAPSPLHATRFWLIDGLSAADSSVIFSSLQAGGYIDAAGYLRDNPDYSGWEVIVPENYRKYIGQIGTQLLVAYAGHTFYSQFDHRVLDFFDKPTTINDAVPQIDSISPTAGYPGGVVTIAGENLVGITEVSFQGVPAVIEAVTPSTIWVYVPPGAISGDISVTNSAGTAQAPQPFLVKGAPSISSFNPMSGVVGSEVQIAGQWVEDTVAVTFLGVTADFTVLDEGVINVTVPPEAPAFSLLSVTTPGGTAVAKTFFTLEQ